MNGSFCKVRFDSLYVKNVSSVATIQLVHFHALSSTSLVIYDIYYSHRNQSKVAMRFND